jgi:hypothetical protein
MRRVSFLWLTVALLVYPLTSSACDFGFESLASLNARTSDIFVGRVVESPSMRKADGSFATTRTTTIRFAVERRFRGASAVEIRLDALGPGGCLFPFLQGERYLVHARRVNGVLESGQTDRPMLIADAREALKYLEAKAANRPVVSFSGGLVLRGESVSTKAFTLKLEGKGGNYSFKLDRQLEMTIAPGEYKLWLEVSGKPVSERITVPLQSKRDSTVRDLRLNVGGVLSDAALVCDIE